MVNFPITVTPSASLRIIPVGTTLVDASMGGQLVVGPGGTIKGESRAGSIVKATSALPRFEGPSPPYPTDNRPYTSGTYPLGNYHNWGKGLIYGADWPNGPALAEVRNLTAWGSQPMAQFPYADAPSGGEWAYTEEQGSGIWMTGQNNKVVECDVYEHRGSGIRINFWQLTGSAGLHDEISVTMPLIENCSVSRCFNGILIDYVDTQIYGCMVSDCRNSGLFSLAGQIQSANNHFYGAQYAMQWGQYGISTGSACKSVNDTVADAAIGLYNASSPHGSAWGMFIQHCWSAAAYCTETTHFHDPRILVERSSNQHQNVVGIHYTSPGSSIQGGNFQLNDIVEGRTYDTTTALTDDRCGCRAVLIENGDCLVDGAYFTARGGPIMGSVDTDQQKQRGIVFKHTTAADKYHWGNQVTNCHFQDFANADCWGVYVEPHPSTPTDTNHAWRGGGNRASIWGRGHVGNANGIGVNDRRIYLPSGWRMSAAASAGSNRVWLNGEELTGYNNGYPFGTP